MDNRLKFRYRRQAIERRSDTGGKADPGAGRPGPSGKAVGGGKSPSIKRSRDGERKISREAADSHCQEKLLSSQGGARTANRHRQAGRES